MILISYSHRFTFTDAANYFVVHKKHKSFSLYVFTLSHCLHETINVSRFIHCLFVLECLFHLETCNWWRIWLSQYIDYSPTSQQCHMEMKLFHLWRVVWILVPYVHPNKTRTTIHLKRVTSHWNMSRRLQKLSSRCCLHYKKVYT